MEIETFGAGTGFRWDHVKMEEGTRAWLAQEGLDRLVIAALTAEDTRPRVTSFGDGAVVVLRGVNLNAGSDPEDMISVRMWLAPGRAVSIWKRPLRAMAPLLEAVRTGTGVAGPGELVSRLALGLTETAGPVIAGLGGGVDVIEDAMIDPTRDPDQQSLSELRRVLIQLKRYFAPQEAAVATLKKLEADWVQKRDRQRLHEASDRFARLTEELDALGQRAQVVQDHLAARQADRMNRQMYVLSLVAALFLPLGFVTGLLGINVGGMPGVESGTAFWVVCGLLVVLAAIQWWLFRALGFVGRG